MGKEKGPLLIAAKRKTGRDKSGRRVNNYEVGGNKDNIKKGKEKKKGKAVISHSSRPTGPYTEKLLPTHGGSKKEERGEVNGTGTPPTVLGI